jgi:hypothetical protein
MSDSTLFLANHIFNNSKFGDIIFHVETNKYIYASEYIIKSKYESFFDNLSISKCFLPTDKKHIAIIGKFINSSLFEKIIWYIYTNIIELDINNSIYLYQYADKLNMPDLKMKCYDFIVSQLENNLILFWETANAIGSNEISQLCKKKYLEIFTVFDQTVTNFLNEFTLEDIITLLDEPRSIAEIELFILAQQWLLVNPSAQDKMFEIMSHIKFHLINPHDLTHIVKKSGLITQEQLIMALQYNINPDLLLPLVLEPRKKEIFVLGNLKKSYNGFRSLWESEIGIKFSKLFWDYYVKNNGLREIEPINPGIISITTKNLISNGFYLRSIESDSMKGSYNLVDTMSLSFDLNSIIDVYITTGYKCSCELYVRNDISFD